MRLFTHVAGEGVIPLFTAFQKKLPGYKESRIIMTMPATEKFAINDAGQWFKNRYEVAPATELLLEYHHRDPRGGFGTETEYLLLRTNPDAALLHIRLELDFHRLSAVPFVFFEGRFDVITDSAMLANPAAWAKHMGLEVHTGIGPADITDPCLTVGDDEPFFKITELEAAQVQASAGEVVIDSKGKRKLRRIKRGRRIVTR